MFCHLSCISLSGSWWPYPRSVVERRGGSACMAAFQSRECLQPLLKKLETADGEQENLKALEEILRGLEVTNCFFLLFSSGFDPLIFVSMPSCGLYERLVVWLPYIISSSKTRGKCILSFLVIFRPLFCLFRFCSLGHCPIRRKKSSQQLYKSTNLVAW